MSTMLEAREWNDEDDNGSSERRCGRFFDGNDEKRYRLLVIMMGSAESDCRDCKLCV